MAEFINGAELFAQTGMRTLSEHETDVPALRLRLLCPHTLVPALIGKKGENVKRIRRDSGATVSVADSVVGCDERVVHIIGERTDAKGISSAADALCSVFTSMCSLQQLRRGDAPPASAVLPGDVVGGADGGDGVPRRGGGTGSGGGNGAEGTGGRSSSASTVGDQSSSGTATGSTQSAAQPLEVRLLVDSSIVGFLVGRGGMTIKDTMARTGAGVRILPKADLPACAYVDDEVVRVVGSTDAVQAALRLLAGQVKTHMLRHGTPHGGGGGAYAGGHNGLLPLVVGQPTHAELAYLHPALGSSSFSPGGLAAATAMPPPAGFSGTAVEMTFRLLAPVNRTGNIIGKGGEHVRRVRAETGARIRVFDPAPGSDERVVALTSTEDALNPYCAAQDALIRCVVALAQDDVAGLGHRVRLLTAQATVGMVLGKRGATVSQLRQETGASIKVLPADVVSPAYGGDDSEAELGSMTSVGGNGGGNGSSAMSIGVEEVIQVEGGVQQCVAALRGVATLLRGWQIRRLLVLQQTQFGGMAAAAATTAMLQQTMPVSPTAGVVSPGSPGILGLHLPSSLGSPVQPNFLMVNGGLQQQKQMLPPGALMGAPPQQRSATYIYHLNNAQVGTVLGKGGSHISQIRSMSGARVQLQGEGEGGGRVLIVAGQPDQCHAAHTVVNAFLSMGRCEPAYPEPVLGG